MGRQSPKVSPEWLQPEKLIEFIDELRGEHNYNIGVSQYIAAQELILALSAKGEQLEKPQRLRNLLGPLLCTSPVEQEDFQRRFDQWIERMGFGVGEVIQEDEKTEAFEQELKKIERQEKRSLRLFLLFAIAISFAILFSSFQIQQSLSPIDSGMPVPTIVPTPVPTPVPSPINGNTPAISTNIWLATLSLLIAVLVAIFLFGPWWYSPMGLLYLKRYVTLQLGIAVYFVFLIAIVITYFLIQQLIPPIVFSQEWQTILLLMLVPLVTFLAWRLWWYWRAGIYLKRRDTRQQPEIQRLSILGLNEELFPSVLFLRIAQGLRRRIRVPSNELDVDKTVEKIVRGGGWFAPVYGYHQVIPEYLVLIDRANYGDHQARFVKEMIAQLTHNGVFITGYYFDGDPRVCFPMTGKEPPSKLREIALKYSQHRLLVFSNADGFFSSLTGEPEPWLDLFSSWPERAVLTPKPSKHWGYQELELSREFIVLPATNDGLIDLIRSIEYGKSPYVPSEKSRAPFPEALRVRGRRWIERDPPEPWLVADVLESLRRYLGKTGYYWLSACAVFPELHWNLTVYLGNMLQTGDGRSLLQACRLTDLARLPWFRYSYMPDWLRSLLIYELSPQQEDEVRQLLRNFLVAHPDKQGTVGRRQLEIARQYSNVVSRLAQPLLHLLSREVPPDSPLRDYIFQEFMTGSKRLAVRMPEELREQLRRKYSQQIGWGLWFQWVLATAVGLTVTGVVVLPVGFAMSNAVTGVVIRIVIFAVIGVVIGAYTGLAQWLLLRKQLFQADWWILATALGWALGLALFSVVNDAVNNTVSGAVIGTVMGLAQWLVLRTQLFHTGWWIVATILGLTLGFAMNDVLFRVVNDPTSRAIIGAVIGVIYGAITGNALVWLLRQPGNYLLRQRRMEILNYLKYHRRFERLS